MKFTEERINEIRNQEDTYISGEELAQIVENQEKVERLRKLIDYNSQKYLDNDLIGKDVWWAVIIRDYVLNGDTSHLNDKLKEILETIEIRQTPEQNHG